VAKYLLPSITVKIEQVGGEVERGGQMEASPTPLGGTQQPPITFCLTDHHRTHLIIGADVTDECQPLIGAGGSETAADEMSSPVLTGPRSQYSVDDLPFIRKGSRNRRRLGGSDRKNRGERIRRGDRGKRCRGR
jgi:hypothetical protein